MKKLLLVLSMLICIFAITACSSKKAKEDETYNGMTKQDLQESSENLLDTLVGFSDEELKSYLTSSDTITVGLIESWQKIKDRVGNKVEFEKFEVTESGHSVTTVLTEKFEKRSVILTINYDSEMTVTSITTDVIYSTNEIMKKAGLNTIMGIGTVFCILILISLLISCFSLIPKIQAFFEKKEQVQEDVSVQSETAPAVEENLTDDLELVAVISAAIAASTGTSTDSFVVRTIKRRNNKWQKA